MSNLKFIPIRLPRNSNLPVNMAYCYRPDGLQVVSGSIDEIVHYFKYEPPFHAMFHQYNKIRMINGEVTSYKNFVTKRYYALLGKVRYEDSSFGIDLCFERLDNTFNCAAETETYQPIIKRLSSRKIWFLYKYIYDKASYTNKIEILRSWRKLPNCYLNSLMKW